MELKPPQPPRQPYHRFAGVALGASMWFFVRSGAVLSSSVSRTG